MRGSELPISEGVWAEAEQPPPQGCCGGVPAAGRGPLWGLLVTREEYGFPRPPRIPQPLQKLTLLSDKVLPQLRGVDRLAAADPHCGNRAGIRERVAILHRPGQGAQGQSQALTWRPGLGSSSTPLSVGRWRPSPGLRFLMGAMVALWPLDVMALAAMCGVQSLAGGQDLGPSASGGLHGGCGWREVGSVSTDPEP